MSRPQVIPLQYRIAALLARTSLQRLWETVYLISLRGLGYNNYISRINGEDHFARRWLERNAKPHLTVFDVGANVGEFTAHFMAHAPESCDYFLFEPNPRTFARLAARFAAHPNVRLEPAGVGASPQPLTLYDVAGSDGTEFASCMPESISKLLGSAAESTRIDVVTLDAYCSERGIEYIDYLKIDTEGFEREVLRGAEHLIAGGRIDVIQLEWNEHHALSGFSLYQLSRMLPEYEIHRLLPHGTTPVVTHEHPYSARFEIARLATLVCSRGR